MTASVRSKNTMEYYKPLKRFVEPNFIDFSGFLAPERSGGDRLEPMSMEYRYVHFHGFASSSRSTKGVFLAEAFESRGVHLELPDLNRPSFEHLTYTEALTVMNDLDAGLPETTKWRISGSSMGGYLAARWAELHPARLDRLALLCPGFNLGARWPDLVGRDRFEFWQRDGTILLPNAVGEEVPVHWNLIEDFKNHPAYPEVPCPTLILHGTHDEVVPFDTSKTYAAIRQARVRLIPMDDDHHLMNSLQTIRDEIFTFFEF